MRDNTEMKSRPKVKMEGGGRKCEAVRTSVSDAVGHCSKTRTTCDSNVKQDQREGLYAATFQCNVATMTAEKREKETVSTKLEIL